MNEELKELYKAVKWEVEYFHGDHGCNMVQMWKLCTGQVAGYEKTQKWWKKICLEDYREGVKR